MKKLNLKKLLFPLVIILISGNLFAQSAYINIHVGQAVSMSSQNVNGFNNYNNYGNSSTTEQISLSLGKGFNVNGAFGFMFSHKVGAELGLSYLIGGVTKAKDLYEGGTTDYSISAKMLRIIPSIVISSGHQKISPYAKLGMVIGFGSVKEDYLDNDNGDVSVMTSRLHGGMATGVSSVLGVMFNFAGNISVFGEAHLISLTYAPTKGELTKASYNGIDVLPSMTTNDKEIEFVDRTTHISGSTIPDSQPAQQLKERLPFGSFGINFGVRIGL